MIWFTADTHFGHTTAIQFPERRKFETVEDMNQSLIDSINRVVMPGDVLYHLGDWGFRLMPWYWRYQLRVKTIHLVLGNHDQEIKKDLGTHFTSVQDTLEIKHNKQRVFLSHYPHAAWPGSHNTSWHCFGHLHSEANDWAAEHMPGSRSMDVGVDNAAKLLGDFRPFSWDEISYYLKDRSGHLLHPLTPKQTRRQDDVPHS